MDAASATRFELDGVSFCVDGQTLLQSLRLTFSAQRITGLIGHNGSGKSTLLKLLARQLAASSGTIRFAGKVMEQWRNRAFAQKVAYLPQQTPNAPGMLVHELVALGRYPWHGVLGRFNRSDHAKVAEAIALTDIEPLATRLVDALSGGEVQRVWLAMLIAQDASWLLLDEPISSLDVAHQVSILDLVHRLSNERGLGVVIVLHDVNMAARFCDEIVALHTGRVIARGPPALVIDSARLEEIYGLPMGIMPHPLTGIPICYVR
jgi:iron-chelate-transporting ATPase